MGMILTLYLISANVYNAVEAPSTRGFSYIEVWILGTQAPILLALFEYGFILLLKKLAKEKTNEENQQNDSKCTHPCVKAEASVSQVFFLSNVAFLFLLGNV